MTHHRKEGEKLRAEASQTGSDSSSTAGASTNTKSTSGAKRVTKSAAAGKNRKRKTQHDTEREDCRVVQEDELKDVHLSIENSEDEMEIVHKFCRTVKRDSADS